MNFETGVMDYVIGTAEVKAAFPVDSKGKAHVKCDFCKFYDRISKRCKLDDHVIYFPDFISEDCELNFEKENE